MVLLVLASTALLKFADLNTFRAALQSWTLLPPIARDILGIGVPAAELTLAGLWFSGIAPRPARAGAALFLLIATGAYAAHALLSHAPDCGCWGLIAKARADRADALALVARNTCLLALLGVSRLADRRPRSRSTAWPCPAPRASSGFTLVELILVLAILALLVMLIMPTLGDSGALARRIAARSSLGQHARVVAMYLGDWDDAYPIYADPDADMHFVRSANRTLTYERYFDIVSGWHVALADQYYDGRSDGRDFQRRDALPEFGFITPYFYSSSFLAHPAFWNELTRTGPEQWGGVRDAQVRWPSSKVLFIDHLMWDQTARPRDPNYASERNTDVALLDASARLVRKSQFEPPYPFGEGRWEGSVYDWGLPGYHTRDGVAGRDIR